MREHTSSTGQALITRRSAMLQILAGLMTVSCTTRGKYSAAHLIAISVKDQRLAVLLERKRWRVYPVSTSRFGVGERSGFDTTPRGLHKVAEKIGDGYPVGAVFEGRVPTGEIVAANTLGRWPVTTRIMRLSGCEERNQNTFERLIYIHGSPVEELIGRPASGGCIGMKAEEAMEVFDVVSVGTRVYISEDAMPEAQTRALAVNGAQCARAHSLRPQHGIVFA